MFYASDIFMLIPTVPKWMLGIIIVLLCLTVVGIPMVIVMIIYIKKTNKGTLYTSVNLEHGEDEL